MTSRHTRSAAAGTLIAALAATAWLGVRAHGTTVAADRAVALYAFDQMQGSQIHVIDGTTLNTTNPARPMTFGTGGVGPVDHRILASADGSTLLALSARQHENAAPGPRDITVRVYDPASGSLRATYHPALAIDIGTADISPDGRQLAGIPLLAGGQPFGWAVLNARNGRIVRHFSLPGDCCGPTLYDPLRNRLYVMNAPAGWTAPVTVTAYRLTNGRRVRGVTLKSVLVGQWTTGKTVNGAPVMGLWQPGMALSPDGRQIAVVSAQTGSLKVIDTASMKVIRTAALAREQSVLDRIGGWLGLLPAPASAKEIEGVDLQLRYSSDGTQLYLTGSRGSMKADGALDWQGLGVRIVDVSTGHIMSEALGSEQVFWMQPAPSGLYTLSLQSASLEVDQGPCTLRRLDPSGEQTLAHRTFATIPEVALAATQ